MIFFHRANIKIIDEPANNVTFVWQLLVEGADRGLTLNSDYLRYYLWVMKTKPPFSLLKEKIISDNIGFLLDGNSFMFEPINKKVSQFVESGLSQRIMKNYRATNWNDDETGPQVLTLDHLGAGFGLWLVCICSTILVFLCEVCFQKNISGCKAAWTRNVQQSWFSKQ